MKKFLSWLIFLVLVASTPVGAQDTLSLEFTEVPNVTGYKAYFRVAPTPWGTGIPVTPSPILGRDYFGTPIIGAIAPAPSVSPGTSIEAAVSAFDAQQESAKSNIITVFIPTTTFTATRTATQTATNTITATATATYTSTSTPTHTYTHTVTPSATWTATGTSTATRTAVNTATPTVTSTATVTATLTSTPTITPIAPPVLLTCDYNLDGRTSALERFICRFLGPRTVRIADV